MITHRTRILLIKVGKILPFLLCSLVMISYFENFVSLMTQDFVQYGDYYVLRKPISWFIGRYFEYNIQMLLVIVIISFAIQTCIYNKLACAYLAINLYEKSYFLTHEFENEIYYIVAIVNVLICAFFCYKGITILFNSRK